MDRLLVELFVESYPKPPKRIRLDLDATDDPVHGNQEGRFSMVTTAIISSQTGFLVTL
jgi:hypothetical protein